MHTHIHVRTDTHTLTHTHTHTDIHVGFIGTTWEGMKAGTTAELASFVEAVPMVSDLRVEKVQMQAQKGIFREKSAVALNFCRKGPDADRPKKCR